MVGRVRKTQKKKPGDTFPGKGARQALRIRGAKDPGLKNPSVTFTVTDSSVLDLVNVEGSTDTMR